VRYRKSPHMSTPPKGDPWTHSHVFDEGNPLAQRYTTWAATLTAVMMAVEIVGGYLLNSMALLADGWHMSSHTVALGVSVLAYICAQRFARDARFAFGTWKIEVLGGYTSAIVLVLVAGLMLVQSSERLMAPSPIQYDEAIGIALLGLLVNLVCAWLLTGSHNDLHPAEHRHEHHHDLNQRAAYLHVIADAATSVLAIIALCAGKLWGASWLDPVMGIAGAGLVAVWAYGLLRDSSRVLLDAEMNRPVVAEIRDVITRSPVPAEISDLHVWRVGKEKYACIVGVITTSDASPEYFRRQIGTHEELVHITVEVNRPG